MIPRNKAHHTSRNQDSNNPFHQPTSSSNTNTKVRDWLHHNPDPSRGQSSSSTSPSPKATSKSTNEHAPARKTTRKNDEEKENKTHALKDHHVFASLPTSPRMIPSQMETPNEEIRPDYDEYESTTATWEDSIIVAVCAVHLLMIIAALLVLCGVLIIGKAGGSGHGRRRRA